MSKLNVIIAELNVIIAIIGVVLLIAGSLIGFVSIPKEEIYHQQLSQDNWKNAIKSVLSYPYARIALIVVISGAILEILAVILTWTKGRKLLLINKLSYEYHHQSKEDSTEESREKIEQELQQINPPTKTLKDLLGKRNIKA